MLVTLAFLMLPRSAGAHFVTTALGSVYDDISHLLMSPEDLVPIIALALLAGLNGAAAARWALFAVTGTWLVGGSLGLLTKALLLPSPATAVSFIALGCLVAADRRLSVRIVVALAVLVGALHGWHMGVSLAQGQREGLGLAGIGSATILIVAIVSALIVSMRESWTRMAVRVAGGWVAAIGLLMLAWSVRR